MSDYIPPPSGLEPGDTVWAYLRDSGGTAQEQSIPQQRAEVKEYCARHGVILTKVFVDEAISGGSVSGRDSFHDLISMATDPSTNPDGIFLWNFARFARDLDDANYYKALLRKRDVIVHSMTDPIPDGPYGRVVETLIDIANEEKRRQNARDVKRALHALVKDGYSCGGKPPRGYKAKKERIGTKRDGSPRIVSKWVPDLELWPLVKMAWAMRAEGAGYAEIRDATKRKLYKSKSSFTAFFANKTYLGIGKCGDLEIPDHHKAAIDRETWDKVQKLRRGHPTSNNTAHGHHPRRVGAKYLLTGIATCVHCGSSMIMKTAGNGWQGYVCGQKTRQGWDSCPGRLVHKDRVELKVWDTVMKRILTPEYFHNLLEKIKAEYNDSDKLDLELDTLRIQLKQTDEAIDNLLDLAEEHGAISVGKRIREHEKEQTLLRTKIHQLEDRKNITQSIDLSPDDLHEAIQKWRTQIVEAKNNEGVQEQRRLLRHFVSEIKMGYSEIHICYTYPIDHVESSENEVKVELRS